MNERLPTTSHFPIQRGSHRDRTNGMCAMEYVAWLAGEQHNDEPTCVCPVLTRVVRAANDLLPSDDDRDTYLRTMLPKLVNSNSGSAVARRRGWLGADCTARFFAALALARSGRHDDAERARALDEVRDVESARAAALVLSELGAEVRESAWVLQRAADGRPPEHWVAGIAHAARTAGAWTGLRRLIDDMLAIHVPAVRT